VSFAPRSRPNLSSQPCWQLRGEIQSHGYLSAIDEENAAVKNLSETGGGMKAKSETDHGKTAETDARDNR